MELNKLDTAIILFSHYGPCQTPCSEGFADAGSPLQDDVLLVTENCHNYSVHTGELIHAIRL